MEIEVAAVSPVDAGPRCRIAAAVVEAAQFLFEVISRYGRAGIEIERLGVDARRHRPQPTLEIPGHDAVEVYNPGRGGDGCERDARHDEHGESTQQFGASHAELSRPDEEEARIA
jgi:hypothetical protein